MTINKLLLMLWLLVGVHCQDAYNPNTNYVGPPIPYYESELILEALTVVPSDEALDFLQWRTVYYKNHTIADIAGIKYLSVGNTNNLTELHIMQGSVNYQRFALQTTIPIPASEATDFTFVFGDYNGDGLEDLYCIRCANTNSGMTELQILDHASNFQQTIIFEITNINDITAIYDIGDLDRDGSADLYAINGTSNDIYNTSVTVLSASSGFQDTIMQTYVPIATRVNYNATFDNYHYYNHDEQTQSQNIVEIFVSDFDNDGYPDINLIKTVGKYHNEATFV